MAALGGGQSVSHAAEKGFTGTATFTHTVSDESGAGTGSVTVSPGLTQTAAAPADDTHAASANAMTDRGATSDLRADTPPTQQPHLKFDLSGLAGAVTNAVPRLHADVNHSVGCTTQEVFDTDWTQSTNTFNYAPAASGTIKASSGRLTANTYMEPKVTSIVPGNRQVSFAIVLINSTALRIASRETTTPPPLIVSSSGS